MHKDKALQIIAENKKSYNAIASDFDITRQTAWPEFEMLAPYIKEGSRILDIGCGNGRLYKYVSSKLKVQSSKYVGIDQSEELIRIAKKSLPSSLYEREEFPSLQRGIKGDFRIADIFNLPFKDGEFNVVAGIAFLHHIPSRELREKCLKEIYRVFSPGGILFLTNWNLWRWEIISHNVKRNKMNPLHFFFPHDGMDAGDFWIPFCASNGENPMPRYYHHFKKNELIKLTVRAGFGLLKFIKGKNNIWIFKKDI